MLRSKDVPLLKRLRCLDMDEDLRDTILSYARKKVVQLKDLKRAVALCAILQHARTIEHKFKD